MILTTPKRAISEPVTGANQIHSVDRGSPKTRKPATLDGLLLELERRSVDQRCIPALYPSASGAPEVSPSESIMKSGQGRLILRDGTDVPLQFSFTDPNGVRRHGSLIGDLNQIDRGEFAYKLWYALADGNTIALLVTKFSDKHLTFIVDFDERAINDGRPDGPSLARR